MGIGARGRAGALPQSPHRTGSSSCSGVPVGLLSYLRAIPPYGALAFRSAYWLSPHHPALRRAGVPFGLLAAPNARTPVASRPTASPNARTPGSLRSPSVYAPKCSFGTFRCSGRLFFEKAMLWPFLQNARPSGSLRSPSGGRGKLRSPLHPSLPPPAHCGTVGLFVMSATTD